MAVGKNTPEWEAGFPVLALAFLFAWISCARVPDGPLGFRILSVEKRYEFLETEGTGASPEIRNAFMEGEVIPGMAREWVLQLYGRPDRITDRSWEFLNGKGKTVLEIFFEKGIVDSVTTTTRSQ